MSKHKNNKQRSKPQRTPKPVLTPESFGRMVEWMVRRQFALIVPRVDS